MGGAGASIIFKSHTKAEVLNGTAVTAGSMNVTAQSKETITGVVAAATGGSTAVGGSLILIIANADTTARIGNNVTINLSGDLTVQAEDIVTIDMTAGTVSGGGAAVGGAAAVLIFKNTVLAEIGTNGTIKAANLNLTANSKRNITSYVAAGSAGVGAVSGSVLVILVGSKQSDDAKTAMTGKNGNNVSSNSQKSIDGAYVIGAGYGKFRHRHIPSQEGNHLDEDDGNGLLAHGKGRGVGRVGMNYGQHSGCHIPVNDGVHSPFGGGMVRTFDDVAIQVNDHNIVHSHGFIGIGAGRNVHVTRLRVVFAEISAGASKQSLAVTQKCGIQYTLFDFLLNHFFLLLF